MSGCQGEDTGARSYQYIGKAAVPVSTAIYKRRKKKKNVY